MIELIKYLAAASAIACLLVVLFAYNNYKKGN